MYQDLWAALSMGFLLDLLFGSPDFLGLPERGIVSFASFLEGKLYRDNDSEKRKLLKGILTLLAVLAVVECIVWGVLIATYYVNRWLFVSAEGILFWGILSVGAPGRISLKLYRALKTGNIEDAKALLSVMTGQDSFGLDKGEVIGASSDHLLENAAYGAAVPIFWMALGGPVFGWLVKAVSVLGDRSDSDRERYHSFGKGWRILRVILDIIPVKLAAIIMTIVSHIANVDFRDETKPHDESDVKKARGLMLETAFIIYLFFTFGLFLISRK